jgi:hypothetical protein
MAKGKEQPMKTYDTLADRTEEERSPNYFWTSDWKPKGARIKWGKCKDNYRTSKCGHYQIETIEWVGDPNSYCCRYIVDGLICGDGKLKESSDTLKDAKLTCERHLRKMQLIEDGCDKETADRKSWAVLVDDGYMPMSDLYEFHNNLMAKGKEQ